MRELVFSFDHGLDRFFQYGCGLAGSIAAAALPNPTLGVALVPAIMVLAAVLLHALTRRRANPVPRRV